MKLDAHEGGFGFDSGHIGMLLSTGAAALWCASSTDTAASTDGTAGSTADTAASDAESDAACAGSAQCAMSS